MSPEDTATLAAMDDEQRREAYRNLYPHHGDPRQDPYFSNGTSHEKQLVLMLGAILDELHTIRFQLTVRQGNGWRP